MKYLVVVFLSFGNVAFANMHQSLPDNTVQSAQEVDSSQNLFVDAASMKAVLEKVAYFGMTPTCEPAFITILGSTDIVEGAICSTTGVPYEIIGQCLTDCK